MAQMGKELKQEEPPEDEQRQIIKVIKLISEVLVQRTVDLKRTALRSWSVVQIA